MVAEEPPVSPEPVSTLWATESGSVVRSLNSTTPFLLNRSRKVNRSPAPIASLLKIASPAAGTSVRKIGQVQSRDIRVEICEIESAPEVWLPAFLLIAAKRQRISPFCWSSMTERRTFSGLSRRSIRHFPKTRRSSAPPMFEESEFLRPEYSPGASGYAGSHQREEDYAWGSLILGKPLAGQRVADILALTSALGKYPATAGRPIHLAALGKLTVPALFAAALAPNIQKLYLAGGLVSFQNVVKQKFTRTIWEFRSRFVKPHRFAGDRGGSRSPAHNARRASGRQRLQRGYADCSHHLCGCA